jgi:hypothetical protein
MPGTGLGIIARVICSATCIAVAAAWPSHGAQVYDDSKDNHRVVAIGIERIDRGTRQVRVFRGNEPVELPRFTELLVAKPVKGESTLEKLSSGRVAIVNSLKVRGQWEVYANAVGMAELALAGNVFKVKRVIPSSTESPVEVRVNGETHHLKPGQVLIVLG